tara:strand:+ start:205 stop:1155 length:951 start_codon:yes stop_codon:yes gene_type:complete
MKIIVTGSTGFIGSKFVEFLTNLGLEVLALGRKDFNEISESKKKKLSKAKYMNLNMRDISLLPEKLEKFNWEVGDNCIFFNLAWGGKEKLSDMNIKHQLINVSWCAEALKIANTLGCKSFIQVGTMEEAFTEKYLELDYKKNSQFNRHVVYSVAKLSAKYSLQLISSNLDINLIYVLHSHVMGPDDDKDSFLQVTLDKLIKGEELIFSSGKQYFDVISDKDCALGYYLICKKGIPGSEYWVGSGNPQPLKIYIEKMYNLYPSGQTMQFDKLPYNDIILTPEDFSIKKLTEDTGFLPTMSYEETVKELFLSMVENRK